MNSPFVVGTPAYMEVVSAANITVDPTDEVNAMTWKMADKPFVLFTEGMMRWISVSSIICMMLDRGTKPKRCRAMFKWCTGRLTSYKAGSDFVDRFCIDHGIDLNTYDMELVNSYSTAITVAILGHELGHLCLHHCDGDGYDSTVMSANRNNERSADLFAASIVQSNGSSDLTTVATIMAFISLKYISGVKSSRDDGMYTHPGHDERVNNMITAFASQLSHSKVTAAMLKTIAGIK